MPLIDTAAYGGPTHSSIATALPIDPYANKFAGNDDRMAVLGAIAGSARELRRCSRGRGNRRAPDRQGHGRGPGKTYTSPAFSGLDASSTWHSPRTTPSTCSAMRIAYTGVIVHMNLDGPDPGHDRVPGDRIALASCRPKASASIPATGASGSRCPTAATLLHLSPSGSLLNEYFVGSNPGRRRRRAGRKDLHQPGVLRADRSFDPTTGVNSFFASSPFRSCGLTWSVAGELWVGDLDRRGRRGFNSSG